MMHKSPPPSSLQSHILHAHLLDQLYWRHLRLKICSQIHKDRLF